MVSGHHSNTFSLLKFNLIFVVHETWEWALAWGTIHSGMHSDAWRPIATVLMVMTARPHATEETSIVALYRGGQVN